MKSFACALLFVAAAYASPAADAEADPALFYSNLGYNYGINGYAGYAVGNRVFNTYATAPAVAAVATPAVAAVAAPAVAVADPVVAAPVVKSVVTEPAAVATVAAPAAVTYAHAPFYNNFAYNGLAYNNLYNYGLGYNNLAAFGAYAHAPLATAAVAAPAIAATHVVAKREADAESEADPAILYSGLNGAYNYGYSAFPYASRAFAYGYNTYNAFPYTYGAYAGYPYAARYLY